MAAHLLILAACIPFASAAQPPAAPSRFWDDTARARPAAVAEIVGLGEPLAVLAMGGYGKETALWGLEPPPDTAPPLDAHWLSLVQDKKPLPDFRERPPQEWKASEKAVYAVYCQALRQAALTPPEAFARSARPNAHVDWGSMFREPRKFRGEVIPIKGRLVRLRRLDAPLPVKRDLIKVIWEGWVFTETYGSNPVCVILTELPAGLKEGEKIDHPVEFNGYFLMRYRYLSGRGWRDTLLFIAPTLTLLGPARADGPDVMFSLSGWMLGGMLVLFTVTVAVVAAMGWWFHRGDRRFERRLGQVRAGMFGASDLATDAGRETVTAVRPELPPGRPDGPGPSP
jgi:hypothetical protein